MYQKLVHIFVASFNNKLEGLKGCVCGLTCLSNVSRPGEGYTH